MDLSHIIFENSDLKVLFSSTGDDVLSLQSLSKKTRVVKTKSTTHRALLDCSDSESELYVPFICEEAVQDASSIFGMAIVVVNDGTGHKEPVFVKMEHRYPRLDHLRLPQLPPTSAPPLPPDPGAGKRIPLDDAERQLRHALIRELIASCEAEERWRGGA